MRLCAPLVRVHKLQNGVHGRRKFFYMIVALGRGELFLLWIGNVVFRRRRGALARRRIEKRF